MIELFNNEVKRSQWTGVFFVYAAFENLDIKSSIGTVI